MVRLDRREWLLSLAAVGVGGCARFAVRPPTPAATADVSGTWEPRPDEKFYLILFGSQSIPKIARKTHTWGVIVRVHSRGEGQEAEIESHTISWLPASLKIRIFRFDVEPGVNLGLHETIRFVLKNNERVSEWGPYECRPRLYYRTLIQKEFLDSGQIGYQAVDNVGEAARKGNGCDCIHALTDQDPLYSRSRYPLDRFGDSATEFIVGEIWKRDVLLNPEQTHDWVQEVLGLNQYPIVRRCYRGRVDPEAAREAREAK
jgi:hypothetical protein